MGAPAASVMARGAAKAATRRRTILLKAMVVLEKSDTNRPSACIFLWRDGK